MQVQKDDIKRGLKIAVFRCSEKVPGRRHKKEILKKHHVLHQKSHHFTTNYNSILNKTKQQSKTTKKKIHGRDKEIGEKKKYQQRRE